MSVHGLSVPIFCSRTERRRGRRGRRKKRMRKLFRGAILGAPASGKGTLSSRIVNRFGVEHVSTGDIFLKNIVRGTPLGKSVQKYTSRGQLVPDVLVMRIALDVLNGVADRDWLLDGFPRTVVQAEKLFMRYPLDVVINLKVPFQVILDRVKDRWVHAPSGRVYNLSFKPPKVAGVDDVTGEPLVQRPDDRPEAVAERLNVYSKTTGPLLDFYRKQRILREFTGDSSEAFWPLIEKELLQYMCPKS